MASRGKVHTTMFHWCLHIVHIYVIVASISEDTCVPYTSEEGIPVAKPSSIMGLDKTESNLSKATVASQPMHLGSPPCALFRQNPTYKILHVVQEQAEDEEKKVGEEERDERYAPKKVRPSVLAKDTAKLEAGMGCARLRSPTEGVSSDTRTVYRTIPYGMRWHVCRHAQLKGRIHQEQPKADQEICYVYRCEPQHLNHDHAPPNGGVSVVAEHSLIPTHATAGKEEKAPTKVHSSVLATLMAKLEPGSNMVLADDASHAHTQRADTPSISKSYMWSSSVPEAQKREERAPTKVSSSVLAALMAKLESGPNMVLVNDASPHIRSDPHIRSSYMCTPSLYVEPNATEECKVGVKPPSMMVLGQAEPNPFKLSIETSLRSHCMMVQKTPPTPARDTQPKSKVKPECSLESKGLNVDNTTT